MNELLASFLDTVDGINLAKLLLAKVLPKSNPPDPQFQSCGEKAKGFTNQAISGINLEIGGRGAKTKSMTKGHL